VKTKRVAAALALAVAIVAALAIFAAPGCAASGSASAAAPEESWVLAKKDDLVLGVDVTGTLAAEDSDLLGPPAIPDQWDYKIAFMAPEGAAVKKGQPVLAFDDTQLARKLAEKQNEGQAAKMQMDKKASEAQIARRDEELKIAEAAAALRKAKLKVSVPSDLAGALELTKARVDADVAEKDLAYTRARAQEATRADAAELAGLAETWHRATERVREMEAYMTRLRVSAPRDGIVIYSVDWQGNKKKVGDSSWRAEKVLEVDQVAVMKGKGEVDEVDSSRVAAGEKVTLRLDAHPDIDFTGKVADVEKIVSRQSSKNPLKVTRLAIALDKTDPIMMLPGMRFRGTIETGRVNDVVVVPVGAVFATDAGPVVWKKTARGALAVKVEVGARNKEWIEVRTGIAPGESVSRVDLGHVAGKGAP
jgi:multidrug efflux pump subunit AcrA (membrane-fusion protein)